MVKKKKATWWKNSPKFEVKIFRRLEDGSKTFGELLKELRRGPQTCGTQTLTVYLKNLNKRGCVERKKRGRNVFYTLIRSNPYVRQRLGWDWLPGSDVRIYKRVELNRLDEDQFIASWLNSVKFSLLNIIQAYMLLGERAKESSEETGSVKTLRNRLEGYVSDLVGTVTFHGEVMAKEITVGVLNPERIWEVRNKLKKQIDNEIMGIG